MKRVEKNDPVALCQEGKARHREGNYEGAFEYYTKAAGLGDMEAHFQLSVMYRKEEGVEKDEKKNWYHMEEAARGGHADARFNLGCHEKHKGRHERAGKHWIIAANLGHNDSLKMLRKEYAEGHVSKEDYLAALRGYQAAIDATKSQQRKAAEAAERALHEEG